MRFLFALLVMALASVSASAQSGGAPKGTVQELLGWCKRNQSDALYEHCFEYIAGVSDMMWQEEKMLLKAVLCPSGDAPHNLRVQAFINWAEKNPKRWNAPRRIGVRTAISETWPGPCKS